MHICFLTNEYPPARHGGIGSFVQTLARALAARGHTVTSLGIYWQDRLTIDHDEGVRIIRLPRPKLRGVRLLAGCWRTRRWLAQIHRENPIDILEGPDEAFVVTGRFPVPKVLRGHGALAVFSHAAGRRPNPWFLFQERWSYRTADYLCSVSRYVADLTRRLLRLGDRPIEVIPNPIDLKMFQPRDHALLEPGRIVFAGSLCERKGIRQLVQAMPHIVAAVPHAHLEAYGADTIDPDTGASYLQMLRRLVAPSLQDKIRFCGAIPRSALPDVLARAEVCVYPSHMEAHPIAWLEGMAMGKAVVASRTGPGPEVIEDEVSGLLCDPARPESIAQAVVRVLTDATLRNRLGQAARRRAETEWDLEILVERNLDFYRRCREDFAARLKQT